MLEPPARHQPMSACVCTLVVLCKTLSRQDLNNWSQLQLSGTILGSQAVHCDTSALFLSYLTSRMFLLTDALLISQNFSLVTGHSTEETLCVGSFKIVLIYYLDYFYYQCFHRSQPLQVRRLLLAQARATSVYDFYLVRAPKNLLRISQIRKGS